METTGAPISHLITITLDNETYLQLAEIVERKLPIWFKQKDDEVSNIDSEADRIAERESLLTEVFYRFMSEDRAGSFAKLMSEDAIEALLRERAKTLPVSSAKIRKLKRRYDITRLIQDCVSDFVNAAPNQQPVEPEGEPRGKIIRID